MYLNKIIEMHKKFGIDQANLPGFTLEERRFRIAAMQEELDEFIYAVKPHDELDALVDLLVFTLGTVERMGFADKFDEAFNLVMESNMQKELGPNQKRNSFALDLVKPEGFKPADLKPLFED